MDRFLAEISAETERVNMKISEYRSIAGTYLKGRYGEAFVVTAICLFVFVAFKAAAAAFYAFSNTPFSSAAEAVITVICFFVMTPLLTGGFWWFFQTVCGQDNRNLLKLYSGFRLNSRAALLYAIMWVKGFLSLFPSAACFTGAYVVIYGNIGLASNISVFAAFQFFMLGIVLLGLYFSTSASMVLAPFIFISHPDRNPFRVIRSSSKLMKGQKLRFLRLIFVYIPAMLPVVTIPFVMPSAIMSAAVFAREIINKVEYE